MTTPQGMLADKIGAALERYLCANNSATKVVEELELQRIFWDNKAGIVAYLRQAAAHGAGEALDQIVGHLGAALVQSSSADDQIIMDHVRVAHELAKTIRRRA